MNSSDRLVRLRIRAPDVLRPARRRSPRRGDPTGVRAPDVLRPIWCRLPASGYRQALRVTRCLCSIAARCDATRRPIRLRWMTCGWIVRGWRLPAIGHGLSAIGFRHAARQFALVVARHSRHMRTTFSQANPCRGYLRPGWKAGGSAPCHAVARLPRPHGLIFLRCSVYVLFWLDPEEDQKRSPRLRAGQARLDHIRLMMRFSRLTNSNSSRLRRDSDMNSFDRLVRLRIRAPDVLRPIWCRLPATGFRLQPGS
jgi:hypothetical protein